MLVHVISNMMSLWSLCLFSLTLLVFLSSGSVVSSMHLNGPQPVAVFTVYFDERNIEFDRDYFSFSL